MKKHPHLDELLTFESQAVASAQSQTVAERLSENITANFRQARH
jgi:hypothetical protein